MEISKKYQSDASRDHYFKDWLIQVNDLCIKKYKRSFFKLSNTDAYIAYAERISPQEFVDKDVKDLIIETYGEI